MQLPNYPALKSLHSYWGTHVGPGSCGVVVQQKPRFCARRNADAHENIVFPSAMGVVSQAGAMFFRRSAGVCGHNAACRLTRPTPCGSPRESSSFKRSVRGRLLGKNVVVQRRLGASAR